MTAADVVPGLLADADGFYLGTQYHDNTSTQYYDSSAAANHGTKNTTTLSWVYSESLGMWVLNHSGSRYVTLPSGMLNGATSWSLAVWVKPNSPSSPASPIGTDAGLADGLLIRSEVLTGKWNIYARSGGVTYINANIGSYVDQELEHLIFDYDGTTGLWRFHQSGVVVDSGTVAAGKSFGPSLDMRVGGGQSLGVKQWTGLVGSPLIIPRILSDAEIAYLVGGTVAGGTATPRILSPYLIGDVG